MPLADEVIALDGLSQATNEVLVEERGADGRRRRLQCHPEDIDCHKPASWIHDALFQPEPRARYRAMLELGYTDAFRSLHPGEGGHFTFWDYFRQAFEHDRGIRIDHFLLSPNLVERLQSCEIDKGPRTLDKPSDHTPIVCG